MDYQSQEVTSRIVRSTYLVRLVVILWIVLKDLRFLLVVKRSDEIVCSELFSPFLTIYKPMHCEQVQAAAEVIGAHICLECSTLNFLALRKRSYPDGWSIGYKSRSGRPPNPTIVNVSSRSL